MLAEDMHPAFCHVVLTSLLQQIDKHAVGQTDFCFITDLVKTMNRKKHFAAEESKRIGAALEIDWNEFDVEQFRKWMDLELKHDLLGPNTNFTNDDSITTGKIALVRLNEFPNCYTRLEKPEEVEEFHNK